MSILNRKRFGGLSGFTLVEVLIAAIIGSIAISAGFQVLISQNKNQTIQEGVTDMQQNARGAIDEVISTIRKAGYRVPLGVTCLRSWNANPDTIAISYLSEPLCTASITLAMSQPTSELKLVGYDLSCFQDNTWAYIYDRVAKTGEFFYITQVQQAANAIQHTLAALSKSYPLGSQVFNMDYVKYYVSRTDTLHPQLMVQVNGQTAQIYADNINDLQFQYVNADNSVSDTISVDRYVREVAIQLVARTEKSDLFMRNYRCDTLSSHVMVRNLAM